MTATMKAMVLTGHGGLDRYVWHEDWPRPEPGAMEALIRVRACGLNNTDVNTRSGWYSKTVDEATTGDAYTDVGEQDPSWGGAPIVFPRIQGADAVGEVVAVGEGADPALVGRRVMVDAWLRDWSDPDNKDKAGYFGSEIDGGFAEFTTIDARNLAVVQSDLSDAELATFSCSYTTAEGMLARAGVGAGDTVLVPGASGGVGGALVLGVFFWVAGPAIIDLMATDPAVRIEARSYLAWVAVAPVLGIASWMFDGIFIGATRSREMRNSSAISVVIYAAAVIAFAGWGNHGLWAALMVLNVTRAVTLGAVYGRVERAAA